MDVEIPLGEPPCEPRLDRVGATRGGGDVIRQLVEAADRPIVGDPSGIVAEHPVPDPTGLQVVEPVGVEQVEEPSCIGPTDDQLAEGRDVDQAGAVVHRHRLALRIAVVVGAPPVAGPEHVAAELPVTTVDRGPLGGLERPSRHHPHGHARPRWPRGRQPDLVEGLALVRGHLADRRELAHPPLARAHRHRRVPLQQLQRVESLVDREVDVVGGDVLTEAGEALAVAPACVSGGRWLGPHSSIATSESLARVSTRPAADPLVAVARPRARPPRRRAAPKPRRPPASCARDVPGGEDARRGLARHVGAGVRIPPRFGAGLE